MQISDLDYEYPESLIATERAPTSRVALVNLLEIKAPEASSTGQPRELASIDELLAYFRAGDVLAINDTRVLKRRVFTNEGHEILFIAPTGKKTWQALSATSRWKSRTQTLSTGLKVEVIEPGRPGIFELSDEVPENYFEEIGEVAIPPYILKARHEKHARPEDNRKYQTAWAEKPGSLASPTASLHFSPGHIEALKEKGVEIVTLTLHVGLGTFLPIPVQNLADHQMHAEWAEISSANANKILQAKKEGRRVWALGTTATRTLESFACGKLKPTPHGYAGDTDLFIWPSYQFKIVDCLLTNFHQPRTTLLALLMAFADGDKNQVLSVYRWAIEKNFRLFSYGDLSAWIKK